ncbi:acyl-CoA thioesterase [Nitratireductor pacificus]|uniref:4-hydroxylbenzoyl-CoA Thioesterase n=1 Tax=Nitratireductor pacificus pht-3B TaxID=391937 RepID=K2MUB9_9HYPH|nr:acyl-CoA thioesterase [Nitratireductor pacificus]EKF21012.1 4-hydroxylbenzoyl-CoA Thioesterase [Nitratireductor pacificus pht-3B]
MDVHIFSQPVTFGDCDPAGIVFYPNVFRWVDAAFHDCLRPAGGHAAICRRLGAVGLGLIDVNARFRSPILDGDRVDLRLSIESWGQRSVSLAYRACVGDKLVFEAREVRALFIKGDAGMTAGDLSPFREMMERQGHG